MDRLDAMSVLTTIVDRGSLSAAARQLSMPLATLSRKLSDLEAHLKTRLIIRSTRRIALTDAGREYVSACRRILEQVQEAERAVAGEYSEAQGELTISAPILFGRLNMVPVISEFLQQHSRVNVRLVLSDRVVNLLEDHVDLALRIGELADSNLIARQVGSIHRVTCASPAYLHTHGTPLQPQDLEVHQCIVFDSLTTAGTWSYPQGTEQQRIRVSPRLSVNTADAAIAAAIAGLGITRVLSYQVADALRDGSLLRILQSHEPPPVPVSLLHAGQGRLPIKLRAFIDFALPRLKQRLQH